MKVPVEHDINDLVEYQILTDEQGNAVTDFGRIREIHIWTRPVRPFDPESTTSVWYTIDGLNHEIPSVCVIRKVGDLDG